MTPALPDDFPASAGWSSPGTLDSTPVAQNFGFMFDEPPGITGITYGAEYSTDFETWQPIADAGGDGNHLFAMPVATHNRLFMRLVIARP